MITMVIKKLKLIWSGGYNSTEVLINFLFKVLHTNPDMIILYIRHNDSRSYLTKNFKNDYSHLKKYGLFKFGFL